MIYHYVIIFTILGLLWQECKQLYNEGVEGYMSSLFNFIDFTSLQLYIASFTLRYMSFYKVNLFIYSNSRKNKKGN